jgi:hypothetical protein
MDAGPRTGELRVRLTPEPPAQWDALLHADPSSSPSQRSGLLAAIAAVLPGYAVEYLIAEDAAGLAGGMAFGVQSVAGAQWLYALPLTLPGAPVARPADRAAVDAALSAALAERAGAPHVAGGAWIGYRPGAPLATADLERPVGETRRLTASVIELKGGGAKAWDSDKRERRELRRAALAGIRCEEDPAALDACYALHARQARGWPGHRPVPLALLRRLLAAPRAGEIPLARLFTARSATRLLSGLVVLDHAHETLAWWIGTHPAAREVAASRALLVWAVGWATRLGRRRFNLGGSAGLSGVQSFKHSMGAREIAYPVRWLAPSHRSVRVRLLAAVQRRTRRGRHLGGAP